MTSIFTYPKGPLKVRAVDSDPGLTQEVIDFRRKIWPDGFITGRIVETKPDGSVDETEYLDGRRYGEWIQRFPNGRLKSIVCYDEMGLRTGKSERWIEIPETEAFRSYTGSEVGPSFRQPSASENIIKVWEGTYVDGRLEGIVKEYDTLTGQIKSETTYKNGHEKGPYTWYRDDGSIFKQDVV